MHRHASFALLSTLLLSACGEDAPPEASGGAGGALVASSASTASTASSGGGGGGSCAGIVCEGPGEVCSGGACVEDCRKSGANPCEAPSVCDASNAAPGRCVAPDAACVATSVPEACGDKTCGPGSFCDSGRCYPRVPCAGVACEGATCYGTYCACTRDAPCSPAPLGAPGETGTLHDPAFLAGLVDLEFDPTCGAWGVTLISGADYLRGITPGGEVAEIPGVTNLDMGEVAVLRQIAVPKSGEQARDLEVPGLDVSLTYICCDTCGCQLDGTPQGAARLDPDPAAEERLPLVIPSQSSTKGAGPFGQPVIDAGPAGLAYGLDRVVYLGNVDENGDYVRLDLETQTRAVVAKFDARVHAATAFDAVTMLVALEGGEIRRLRLSDGTSSTFATSEEPVVGLARDFFDGSIYVSRRDGSIVVYDEDGTVKPFQKSANPARIALGPDGFLYALAIPPPFYDHVPTVERWELPKTR